MLGIDAVPFMSLIAVDPNKMLLKVTSNAVVECVLVIQI